MLSRTLKTQKSNSRLPKASNSHSKCEACKRLYNNNNKLSYPCPKHNKQDNSLTNDTKNSKKLFTIIQSFHNNLCSLPLNLLLSNTQPDHWLQQQYQTLSQLTRKLQIHSKNPQAEYYKAKMQSVKLVLQNIAQNLETLRNFKQTLQYNSSNSASSNPASSGASSFQNSHNRHYNFDGQFSLSSSTPDTQRFSPTTKFQGPQKQNRPNSMNVVQDQKFKKNKQMPETNFTTSQGSAIQVQQQCCKCKNHNLQVENTLKTEQYKIQQGEYKIGSEDVYSNMAMTKIHKHQEQQLHAKYRKNIETIKQSRKYDQNSNLFALKTHKSQQTEQDIIYIEQTEQSSPYKSFVRTQPKGILLDKIQNNESNKSTKRILGCNEKNQNKTSQNNSTVYVSYISQLQHSRIQQLQQDLNQTKEELKQTKLEVQQKNRQIQQLLIRQQQLEQVIGAYQVQVANQNNKKDYETERIKVMQQVTANSQKQIKEWKQRQFQLRTVIKQQRQINKKLEKTQLQLEHRLNQQLQEINTMRNQCSQMSEEVKKLRRSQAVAQEKLSIYKEKYHKIIHKQQISKIVMSETYQGKSKKFKQLQDLIEDHRKNLGIRDELQNFREQLSSEAFIALNSQNSTKYRQNRSKSNLIQSYGAEKYSNDQ